MRTSCSDTSLNPAKSLPISTSSVRTGCLILAILAILEILSFTVGGLFAFGTACIWFVLGIVSVAFLCGHYLAATYVDFRRGALWGLLPLVAAIPLCFFQIDTFTLLNTESLSELHDTYLKFQQADLAYTSVFWNSYPSRSLLLNLVPTGLFGVSPWSYRVGFSYPIMLGALFLFTGIRRYHHKEPGASAIAGLVSAGIFTFPMFCQISRTFEMAISSVSFGMWAMAATFLFIAQPTVLSALTAAWTIGLLAASFTSGLATVALLLAVLALWACHLLLRKERPTALLTLSVLLNCIIVTAALFLIRSRPLRAKQIPFDQMLTNFIDALHYTASLSQPVFTPSVLVIPVILGVIFAVSLRGGLLPLILTGWCFPVIWSAANMHGKIGPQLPFALYRSLIIIPVMLYLVGCVLLWVLARCKRYPLATKPILVLLALSLYFPLKTTYRTQPILHPPSAPQGRELVAEKLTRTVKEIGFGPFTNGWIANRTDSRQVENFLPCLQYFFLNWTRIDQNKALPSKDSFPKGPGIIVTMQGDSLTSQLFEGYQTEVIEMPLVFHQHKQVSLSLIVLKPT